MLGKLHQQFSGEIQRQSGRDFPRGSVRNGIMDGTKCQSSEIRGDIFLLLCLVHTKVGRKALEPIWKKIGIGMEEFCNLIKLYLSTEEWFHSSNPKSEV